MTRQTVRSAYAGVHPTQEDKEKMLKNIMESKNSYKREKSIYRSAPSKAGGFSTIAAVLALAAVLAVAVWFGKDYWIRSGTPDTLDTVPANEQQSGVSREDSPQHYEAALDKYVRAVREGWGTEKCSENEISMLCAEPETAQKLGYALVDLDENGEEELIVAADEESQVIVDLYTLSGGVPVRVFSSEESSLYFLKEGNRIENIILESGSCTNYIFSRLNGAELIQEDILRFDTLRDLDNPWFMGFDLQPISEEEAKAVIDANARQRITLTPISELA